MRHVHTGLAALAVLATLAPVWLALEPVPLPTSSTHAKSGLPSAGERHPPIGVEGKPGGGHTFVRSVPVAPLHPVVLLGPRRVVGPEVPPYAHTPPVWLSAAPPARWEAR